MPDPTHDPGATPEAGAARAELQRLQTDPTHPLHGAWKANDGEAVRKHMESFYKKVPGADTPVAVTQGLEAGGPPADPRHESPADHEARVRGEAVLAGLQREWGADFDAHRQAYREEARFIFNEGLRYQPDVLKEIFGFVASQYGARGEIAGAKFLRELARIRKGG